MRTFKLLTPIRELCGWTAQLGSLFGTAVAMDTTRIRSRWHRGAASVLLLRSWASTTDAVNDPMWRPPCPDVKVSNRRGGVGSPGTEMCLRISAAATRASSGTGLVRSCGLGNSVPRHLRRKAPESACKLRSVRKNAGRHPFHCRQRVCRAFLLLRHQRHSFGLFDQLPALWRCPRHQLAKPVQGRRLFFPLVGAAIADALWANSAPSSCSR